MTVPIIRSQFANGIYCYESEDDQKLNSGSTYNLSVEDIGSVNSLDMRKVRHSHDLSQQLEATGNHCLGGHNSCENSDDQTKVKRSWRHGVEERIGVCSSSRILHSRTNQYYSPGSKTFGMGSHLGNIRRLSDICKKQARECKEEPRDLDSPLAESPQIRKESFNTCKSQQQTS